MIYIFICIIELNCINCRRCNDLYRKYEIIYKQFIVDSAQSRICVFDIETHTHIYKPYTHVSSSNGLSDLAELIVDDMIFYAYSEDEIVSCFERTKMLEDLKSAAQYAYKQRLPNRPDSSHDGTSGEILLDIMLQVFEEMPHKLIARPKYKQIYDNCEIKGYDALFFTKSDNEISLWLGQVKTGQKSYCKSSIKEDLNKKYTLEYFCKSLYYIADKTDHTHELEDILSQINNLCFEAIRNGWTDEQKSDRFIQILISNKVKVKIPCLLVYSDNIFNDLSALDKKIRECTKSIVEALDLQSYSIANELNHSIYFYVFPVKDVDELRDLVYLAARGD